MPFLQSKFELVSICIFIYLLFVGRRPPISFLSLSDIIYRSRPSRLHSNIVGYCYWYICLDCCHSLFIRSSLPTCQLNDRWLNHLN